MFKFAWLAFGFCFAGLMACTSLQENPEEEDPIADVGYGIEEYVMGADLSYVNVVQEEGGYFRKEGQIRNPFEIFREKGANLVRVRLWHHPKWQLNQYPVLRYSHLADVEKTIQRAKDAGMAVNLDFHYSDDWADPGRQDTPEAWKGLPIDILADSVYNYTLNTLNYLKEKDLTPEFVQVGNENNGGMCWPAGRVSGGNWDKFALLLSAGIKAVRDFSTSSDIKPKIILHVAQFQNADWWADGVIVKGGVTDFDIIGISHYFIWSDVKTMEGITQAIQSLKNKYEKEIMVVETAYPWTNQNADSYGNIISGATGAEGYGVSMEEQLRYMQDLTQAIIDGGGSGIMYWEPGWISSGFKDRWGQGSSWENNAFFDFTGEVLPVMDFMTTEYQF